MLSFAADERAEGAVRWTWSLSVSVCVACAGKAAPPATPATVFPSKEDLRHIAEHPVRELPPGGCRADRPMENRDAGSAAQFALPA